MHFLEASLAYKRRLSQLVLEHFCAIEVSVSGNFDTTILVFAPKEFHITDKASVETFRIRPKTRDCWDHASFKSFTFVMLLLHPRREGGGTQVYY